MAEYDELYGDLGDSPGPVVADPGPSAPPVPPPTSQVVQTPRGEMRVPVGAPGADIGPSPQDWNRVNDYMTQMSQLGRMKEAEQDVSSAMRFLGMRGMERDIRSGVPNHIAIANNMPYLTWGHPEHIPAYMRAVAAASRPPAAAAPVGPVQGQQVLDTMGAPVPGLIATPGVRGGHIVHRLPPAQITESPATARLRLKDQIRYKEDAIQRAKDDLNFVPDKDKAGKAAAKAKVDALSEEREVLVSQVGGPKEEKPTPGTIAEPKTREEYEAIPKGARYHHPDDPPGKYRVKK